MSTLTLYELATEYREDAEKLADLDLPPEVIADTLEGMGGELEVKAQNVVMFARNLEALAAQIKDAETQMAARRKSIENRAAHLRDYTLACMQMAGVKKIEGPMMKISVRANPASVEIFDEKMVPPYYMRQPEAPPPSPDKNLIAQAIKDGYEVPGARMADGRYRLEVK